MYSRIVLQAVIVATFFLPGAASAGLIVIDTVPGLLPGGLLVRDLQVTPEITAGQTFRTGDRPMTLDELSL